MIVYDTERGDEVTVVKGECFFVDLAMRDDDIYTRDHLTQLRDIINQALNTSADELYDGAVSRFPEAFRQLGES